ncbi:hypothetical protein AB0M28_17325 [Streptomyces sp. NPDC051940]
MSLHPNVNGARLLFERVGQLHGATADRAATGDRPAPDREARP